MAKRALIILDLKLTKFKKGLQSASKGWKKWSRSILSVRNMLMAGFAGYGASQLIAFGKESIQLATVQAEAEARLAAAMKNKGVYTRRAYDELTAYASELQGLTTIGDEVSISTMAMLQAFGLTNEEMKKATLIAADFAASGKDMNRIAELIGRAKMGETGALSRYGVVMTEVAKRGGDFNAILSVMADLHRGEAAALRATPLGKLKAMANSWGDIKDSIIGPGLADAFSRIGKSIMGGAENMDKWVSANKAFMASEITAYILDFAAAMTQLVGSFQKLGAINLPLRLIDVFRGKDPFKAGREQWEKGTQTWGTAERMWAQAEETRWNQILKTDKYIQAAMENIGETMKSQSERIKRQEDRASIGN